METVAEIAAGKPCPPLPLQPPQLALRSHCCGIEHRVRVVERRNHVIIHDLVRRIERDEQIRAADAERLEIVHPVAERKRAIVTRPGAEVVPARPQPPALWHEAGIAMQHRAIGSVAKGAKQATLIGFGIGEQRKGFVRVGGDDASGEAFLATT